MSLRYPQRNVAKTCFPRVSGDEPDLPLVPRQAVVFSPRERG